MGTPKGAYFSPPWESGLESQLQQFKPQPCGLVCVTAGLRRARSAFACEQAIYVIRKLLLGGQQSRGSLRRLVQRVEHDAGREGFRQHERWLVGGARIDQHERHGGALVAIQFLRDLRR